ncbi:MAG: hypothetical protein ACQXXF_03195 [Thermoplasmatota archaeon]|jgi:hypothetical protein
MNKKLVILIILLLSFQTTIYAKDVKQNKHSQLDLNNLGSNRNTLPDAVIIPDSDPFFGIIGSYIACWYDKNNNSTGLLPLLVKHDEKLTSNQEIFLNQYLIDKEKKLLVLGEKLQTKYETVEILGSSPNVSISVATLIFTNVTTVLIVPYRTENAYQQSLIASPLASYLNIPILIFDNNTLEIINVCNSLNVSNAYIIGDVQLILPNITTTVLKTTEEIQNTIISIIKNQFNSFDYITLANPSDTIQYYLTSSNNTKFIDKIKNVKLTILGKEIDIIGTNVKQYNINIPGGINLVKIFGNITGKKTQILNLIKPVIYMFLYDPQGNIVAYSNSLAYETGKTYVETLTINASGNYLLILKLYNGIKGGYFSQRGFSQITTDIEISINISTLEKPHMPSIPNLSMLAPYLTSAHGGIILADPNFEITDENYTFIANGSGTSPCYNESLHDYTNQKVNYTIKQIKNILSILDNHSILNNYLNGPAWLAIIADTNMVPMYYYGPSQQGLLEKGLPSDNPYSLNFNLSVGRIIGWDVQDVSLLISRTFFYKDICDEPKKPRNWHNSFSFIFGEGFGETGGFFHQIPYSIEIRKYGFKPRVFGDFRNGRQISILLKTYTGSNYIEYLGHGDWYWFTPSLYGLDYYSKAIDVAHVKNWVFKKPSIFLTSACLMGRVDGIPPQMNIGLTMLHAGCNCFVGSTRETGSEAGLTVFENHLIIDNFSVGEALRGEKKVDQESPNFYVRTLYADPAFNPYEPNNGFSNQGRPILKN